MLYGFGAGYWLMIGVTLLISVGASLLVKGTFARYSKLPTRSGKTGAEIARAILRENSIHDVLVEPVAGNLTDHYDPRSKTLRLSEQVYSGRSMAAFGVAAHEVGHAIQHAEAYGPLGFRSAWVPMANTGSRLSMIVIMIAFFAGGAATTVGLWTAWIAVGLLGLTLVFTAVTLPVEFDASRRAMIALEVGRHMDDEELAGARKVLNAAAMTYVAAFVSSLITLLYWMHRLGLLGGNRR